MKVAVVIAAYDEAGNIGPLTERLVRTLDSFPETLWKLIYVIEGADGTVDIARGYSRERSEIEVLYGEQPSGLGRAFRRGFDAIPSDTDFVVTMDADLNHRPEEIPRLLARLRECNADIVVGSRRLQESSEHGTPAWKRAISQLGNHCMYTFMGKRILDLTSGFRVYKMEALRQIEFKSPGFAFLPEILIVAAARGLEVVEVPITFVFRTNGESKLQIRQTGIGYLRLFYTYFRSKLHSRSATSEWARNEKPLKAGSRE
ncbi:MAG: glycosyltransferase [Candidatus Korobacteraceae bacterium]